MKIRAFITHKKAEQFTDCQDRFGVNSDTKSIAVSDGMSQSWQQKIWAQILVDSYIDSADWQPNNETIKPLCNRWRNKVAEAIEKLKEANAPENLIYRNERNLVDGKSAGATFVGIRFVDNLWNSIVLGDSCLIEWNGENANFHTSQESDTFDNHPDYFDSSVLHDGKGSPLKINGELKKGDILFLVSDPFSDFLLEHNKKGNIKEYIQELMELYSHDEFELLVENWRNEGMHNDDATLVIVEYDESLVFNTPYELDNIYTLIEEEVISKETPSEQSITVEQESVAENVAEAKAEVIPSEQSVPEEQGPVADNVTEAKVEVIPSEQSVPEEQGPVADNVTEAKAEEIPSEQSVPEEQEPVAENAAEAKAEVIPSEQSVPEEQEPVAENVAEAKAEVIPSEQSVPEEQGPVADNETEAKAEDISSEESCPEKQASKVIIEDNNETKFSLAKEENVIRDFLEEYSNATPYFFGLDLINKEAVKKTIHRLLDKYIIYEK